MNNWTPEEIAAARIELANAGVSPEDLDLAVIEALWWADGTHPEVAA